MVRPQDLCRNWIRAGAWCQCLALRRHAVPSRWTSKAAALQAARRQRGRTLRALRMPSAGWPTRAPAWRWPACMGPAVSKAAAARASADRAADACELARALPHPVVGLWTTWERLVMAVGALEVQSTAAAGSREACAWAWVSKIKPKPESTTSLPLMPYLVASALTSGPYSRTIVMSGRNETRVSCLVLRPSRRRRCFFFRVGRRCSDLKGLTEFYPYHNSLQSEHYRPVQPALPPAIPGSLKFGSV